MELFFRKKELNEKRKFGKKNGHYEKTYKKTYKKIFTKKNQSKML